MRVLVTGGAGFIGSNLVDSLVQKGHEVSIIDNLSTGFMRNVNENAGLYRLSILDEMVSGVFQKEQPEIVFHLAAQTSVTKSVADPAFDAETNILGSLNIISNCVKYKVAKIIYASSSASYGTPEYLPVDEKHPINPLSAYGVSKHTIEHYLFQHHLLYGLPYTALRYANVYGPRQNPLGEGGVVAIFSGKMLRGEQPIIYGTGDKSRDYVYVDDVVRANLLAMDSKEKGIFNIGTSLETYDKTVFDLIANECRYTDSPEYRLERPGEIKRMVLSNKLAEQYLKWQPRVNFKDGITKTVAHYREELTLQTSAV
jgi:UDP-glucose 4-epimerase